MADNEPAEGADGADAIPAKKGKLKLLIAVAGFVLILGGGAGWFFFMRGHGEEMHAEAPPPKPPSFVEVPDMMVNLVGAPGERVQYLRVKVVLEVKEELTKRVNNAVAPQVVSAVLFKEIVVQ